MKNLSKSKIKKIKQAINAWNKINKKGHYRARFVKKMKGLGWDYDGSGAYKHVLYKDSVVIKINKFKNADRDEVGLEYEQYMVANNKLKKHLATIYGYYDGLLIQNKIRKVEWQSCYSHTKAFQIKAEKIAKKFNLEDFYQNWGISRQGIIQFHDLVNYSIISDNS